MHFWNPKFREHKCIDFDYTKLQLSFYALHRRWKGNISLFVIPLEAMDTYERRSPCVGRLKARALCWVHICVWYINRLKMLSVISVFLNYELKNNINIVTKKLFTEEVDKIGLQTKELCSEHEKKFKYPFFDNRVEIL